MRRRHNHAIPAIALTLAALCIGACQKKEQATTTGTDSAPVPAAAASPSASSVHVTDVQLGTAIGADKKVTAPNASFSPRDTIFASVSTDGSAASSTLRVKWTYQDGQTVKEDSRTISPTGPAVTEFSIQKPGGWPKGNYKVEVSVDGQVASTKDFKVQ